MQGRITLIFAALMLSACASTQWQRADTSPEQLALDTQACETAVEREFPTSPQPPKELAYETDCATYGNQNNCATGPGPSLATGSRFSQKKAYMQACMTERGYTN